MFYLRIRPSSLCMIQRSGVPHSSNRMNLYSLVGLARLLFVVLLFITFIILHTACQEGKCIGLNYEVRRFAVSRYTQQFRITKSACPTTLFLFKTCLAEQRRVAKINSDLGVHDWCKAICELAVYDQ